MGNARGSRRILLFGNELMNAQVAKTGMIIGAVGIGVYVLYKAVGSAADAGKKFAGKAGEAFNPLSDKNLAYKGANAVVRATTDQSNPGNDSLGGWLAEKFSRAVHDVGALVGKTGGSVPPTVAQTTMAQAPYASESITIAPYNSNQNQLPDTIESDPFSNPWYPGQSFSTAPYDQASASADAASFGTDFIDTSGGDADIAEFLI
jgi:hypothetical protein